MWSLENFREGVEYGVFDDIYDFKPFFYKSWFGAQQQFTATDKYKKKQQINWGNPCILLCNNLPDFGIEEPWWLINCKIVHINNKLY